MSELLYEQLFEHLFMDLIELIEHTYHHHTGVTIMYSFFTKSSIEWLVL
jgi:hypothetical protein